MGNNTFFGDVSPICVIQVLSMKAQQWDLTFHFAGRGCCSYNNGFLVFQMLGLKIVAVMAAKNFTD